MSTSRRAGELNGKNIRSTSTRLETITTGMEARCDLSLEGKWGIHDLSFVVESRFVALAATS